MISSETNVGALQREVKAQLLAHGIENAAQESRWIMEEVLACDQTFLHLHAHEPLSSQKIAIIKNILKRRLQDEPLAYIFARQNFFGLDFKVTPAVLIPRFDTEVLVEKALDLLRGKNLSTIRVIDIGTGSGCIAITIKKHLPSCQIWAWDISKDALEIAKENAARLLGSNHGISFEQKDALDETNWQASSFDVVLTNPPYIGKKETLSPSVCNYEPHLALFGGEDGLEFYQRFFQILPKSGQNDRHLLLECGHQQAGRLQEIMTHWSFSRIEVYQDYRGIARGLKATF